MSLTRKKKLELVADIEAQSFTDGSEILYTFKDGWSIRRITCYRDAVREGILMSNCLCPNDTAEHALWEWVGHPETKWERWEDGVPKTISKKEADLYRIFEGVFPFWGDLSKINLDLCWPGNTVLSLRDSDNYPKATGTEDEILGAHNSELKPEYYYRFEEYFKNEDTEKLSWLTRVGN